MCELIMVHRSNVSTMQCMHRSPADHALLRYLTVYTSTEILLTQGDANQTCYIVFSTTEQFSISHTQIPLDYVRLHGTLKYALSVCHKTSFCPIWYWCQKCWLQPLQGMHRVCMLCCRLYNHHLSKANRFINCHARCHVTCIQHVWRTTVTACLWDTHPLPSMVVAAVLQAAVVNCKKRSVSFNRQCVFGWPSKFWQSCPGRAERTLGRSQGYEGNVVTATSHSVLE